LKKGGQWGGGTTGNQERDSDRGEGQKVTKTGGKQKNFKQGGGAR